MIAILCGLLYVVQAGATMVAFLAGVFLFVQLTEPRSRPVTGRPRRSKGNRP